LDDFVISWVTLAHETLGGLPHTEEPIGDYMVPLKKKRDYMGHNLYSLAMRRQDSPAREMELRQSPIPLIYGKTFSK